MFNNHPIKPKNPDGVLRIISIGRLSQPKETEAETQLSLEAIRSENERLLKSIYDGPFIVRYLAEQISGMIVDRGTMVALWDLVDTGEWDLVIAEDLGRVFRNPKLQLEFLQDCCDKEIRAICFADHIDTADESWETPALVAVVRHGLTIPDTRRRIKRTATTSFKKGGMVMKVKAFYAKVSREDAAAGTYGPKGLRMRKLAEYARVVDEIRQRIHAGESPRSIVAWLNRSRIPCGPYVKSGRWSLKVLAELLKDPILHGTRSFRDVLHKQIYKTGKYRRNKNETPDFEYVPELAFMSREEQEAMLACLGWRIDWGGVKPPERTHPRKGISRYESCWPAQSATCGACDGKMYALGEYLRCSKSFPHLGGTCWNHCQTPIAPLRVAIVEWFVAMADKCAAFREVLLKSVMEQLRQHRGQRYLQRDVLGAKIKDLEVQEKNLRRSIRVAEAIAEEDLKVLVTDLAAVTRELRTVRVEAESTAGESVSPVDYSDDEILERLPEVLAYLLGASFELAEVVRGFVPKCMIVPVQSLDSRQVYPRAKLRVRGNMQDHDELSELVVDLFEPALPVRHMGEVVALRSLTPQPTLKQVGAKLGVSYMTVKRAEAYHRLMEELSMREPYRELTSKPERAARWRDAS